MEKVTEQDVIEYVKNLLDKGYKLKIENNVFGYSMLGTIKIYRIGHFYISFYQPTYLEAPFDKFIVTAYIDDTSIYQESFDNRSLSKVYEFISEYNEILKKEMLLKEELKRQPIINKFLNTVRKWNKN